MAQSIDRQDLVNILGAPDSKRTMAESIADRLRERIIDGQLAPGTMLRLGPIAAQLDVSIMPIREAFRLLESENLLVITPRRGAFVAPLSPEDIEETYAVRVALESLAARHAMERLTSSDLAAIRELYEAMVKAKDDDDLQAFIAADRAFHMRLYVVSGRDRLIAKITELGDRSRRYWPWAYRSWQPLEVALRAHTPLLEAIEDGRPGQVEQLVRDHMEAAGARLLVAIQNEPDGIQPGRRRGGQPRSQQPRGNAAPRPHRDR